MGDAEMGDAHKAIHTRPIYVMQKWTIHKGQRQNVAHRAKENVDEAAKVIKAFKNDCILTDPDNSMFCGTLYKSLV
jgi:hypothetical protein